MKYFVAYKIIEREGVTGGEGSTVIKDTGDGEAEAVFLKLPSAIATKRNCQPDDVVITAFNRV